MNGKRSNQQQRLQFLRAKAERNTNEESEILSLERKLANAAERRPPSRKGRGGRGGTFPIADREVAEGAAAVQGFNNAIREAKLERRVVGGGRRFGMQPLLATTRPDQINVGLLGRTPEGRAWALEALHPCGEWQGAGLPDTYTSNVCVFQHKGETNITFDLGMFVTAPTTPTSTWSVHMLFPPIPEVMCIYRIRSDASNLWSVWRQVRFATTTKNGSGEADTLTDNGYSEYRITAKGETISLDASDLANQGRIVVGQRAAYMKQGTTTPIALTNPTPPLVPVPIEFDVNPEYTILLASRDENELVQISASAYQEQAKRGAYIVHKFFNPLMGYQFRPTQQATTISIGGFKIPTSYSGVDVGYGGLDEQDFGQGWTNDSAYDALVLPPNMPQETNVKYYGLGTSVPCDMTMAETFILNISGGDAVGLNATSKASIRLKSRCTIEAHPAIPSGAVVYARAPPLWDQDSVNAVVRYQEVQPDAYPEVFNGFGAVMGKIFGFLNRWVRPMIKPLTSMIPLPGASLVGDVVSEGIETGDTMLNTSAALG